MESAIIHVLRNAYNVRITKDVWLAKLVTLCQITAVLLAHKTAKNAPIAHNAHNAFIIITISRMQPAFLALHSVFRAEV
jgi:hypothetical protein